MGPLRERRRLRRDARPPAHPPYVLGSEGAGIITAVGEHVDRFKEGDRVYAAGFLNPEGGFYAEYAVVDASLVEHIPAPLTTEQAGVMSGVGLTALRGLDDTLGLKPGESVLGARVFAVASGDDGVELVRRLGGGCRHGRPQRRRACCRPRLRTRRP